MSGDRTLKITILGDATGGKAALAEVSGAADTFGQKVGGALSDVGKIAGGFIVGKAMTELPGILMDGAKGAVEDQAAMDMLRQAVTNTGASYDQYGGAIDEAISRGQDLAFTDGETAQALSTLVALTGSTEEGMARLSAAQDLARGTGMDLQTAAKLLGKTSDENTAALSRYGIQLGENATAQDVLNAVDAKFGGQAGTFAESDAGKLLKSQQAAGELAETFGSFLIPAMLLVSQVALRIGDALTTHVAPAIERVLSVVAPLAMALAGFVSDHAGPILAALTGIATAILVIMIPALVAWAAGMIPVIAAHVAMAVAVVAAYAPIIAIVALVGLAAAALYMAWQSNLFGIQGIVASLWAFIQPIFQSIWDFLTAFATEALPYLSAAWDLLHTAISGVITAISTVVMTVFGAIQAFIQTHGDTIIAILSGAWALIQGTVQNTITVIQGVIQTVMALIRGDWQGAWDGIKTIASGVWSEIQLVVETAIGLVRGIIDRVIGEIRILWDTGWSALTGIVRERLGDAQTAVQGGIDDIKGLFSGAAGWLVQAGRDIVQGLIDGMGELLQSVRNKAGEIADAAKGAITSALGIDSPSRVMMELGRQTSRGFALGIEQGQSDLEKAANKMAAIAAHGYPQLGASPEFGHATNSPFMPHDPYREANVSIELDGRVLARSTSRRLTNNHRFTATTGSGRLP